MRNKDFGIVTQTGESASQPKAARETVCKRGYGRAAIATIIVLSDSVREWAPRGGEEKNKNIRALRAW